MVKRPLVIISDVHLALFQRLRIERAGERRIPSALQAGELQLAGTQRGRHAARDEVGPACNHAATHGRCHADSSLFREAAA